jgi:hypothetical protein
MLSPQRMTWKCPSKAQLEILQTASLRMEATLLPNSSSLMSASHSTPRLAFAETVAQNKFCRIDTKAVRIAADDCAEEVFFCNWDA